MLTPILQPLLVNDRILPLSLNKVLILLLVGVRVISGLKTLSSTKESPYRFQLVLTVSVTKRFLVYIPCPIGSTLLVCSRLTKWIISL